MCHLRQKVWHDLERRVIGLHFNAAQAIGEYVEKAGVTSGPLFRAQEPREAIRPSDGLGHDITRDPKHIIHAC